MKNVKKILSMLLISVMVLTLALPAFAATGGKITITNTQADNLKYQAYQVFKGEPGDGKLVSIEWGNGVNATALLAALKADTTLGTKFTNCTTAEDVAKVFAAEQNDSETMQAISVIVADHLTTVAGTSTQTVSPYTIENLNTGYYFVKDISGLATADGRGSKYAMVNVLDDKATIAIKTEVPTQEKKVYENQPGNYDGTPEEVEKWGQGFNDVADYNINDVVPFELLSTVPNFKGMKTYYYEFQDQYDTAFSLDKSSIKVEVVSKDNVGTVLKTLTAGTDYTIEYIDNPFDIQVNANTTRKVKQFNVKIDDLVKTLGEQYIGQKIKVTFSATLNEGAVIGRPGNRNRSRLIYGNNPNETGEPTPWDEVVVFTYELDVDKFDSADTTKKLMDAEFVFYRVNAQGQNEYVSVDANGKVQGWTAIIDPPLNPTDPNPFDYSGYYAGEGASILKTDATGKFIISGLDEGTYYLKETKAPTGYNKLTKDVQVEIIATTTNGHNGAANALTATMINIDDAGAAHTPNKPDGYETAPIPNDEGLKLPETGGMGTTLFYIIGAALMIGAGVVLVARRRVR
ncbi:MAG: SpaH/EbpB family LPXTG-anchored major pilin [Lachnospiraceae bacterium]|nr:SpaH/EbpB family LPXTG-anchored major pilin [Lachnospiraceae bacterium]